MAKPGPKKGEGGRPKINLADLSFDGWDFLDNLIVWASEVYCAEQLGISIESLATKIKERSGLTFPEYKDKKRESLKICLAQKQFETAMQGNATLQIWLGKQWLGQTDKVETDNTNNVIITLSPDDTRV